MSAGAGSIELPAFLRRTLGTGTRRVVPFDAVVRLRPFESTFMLTHPEDVRHVLVTNAENYTKTRHLSSARGRLRAGEGLLTSRGAAHHRQRRLLQPLFHPRVVDGFAGTLAAVLERWLERRVPGEALELAGEMADLTRAAIVDVLFGPGPREDDAALHAAIRARRRYTHYVYHGRLPLRTRLPTRVVREHRRALRQLDAVIAREIGARRGDAEPRGDLLSLLMTRRYPDDSVMRDRLLRDEVLTLTSTGYETLGEALTWSWLLLARHPEVEERFAAEARAAATAAPPTAEHFEQLPVAESVLRESMRLYPPTWIFERVPIAADTLPSGATVPAGAKLYLCQWVLHRHPTHFPEPEAFRPERFEKQGRRPFRFVYLPFGDGAHTCLGETFANLQGVMTLARLGRELRFELLPGPPIVPAAGITLTPRGGVRVRVEAR